MNPISATSSPFDSFKSKKLCRSSVSKSHSPRKHLTLPQSDPKPIVTETLISNPYTSESLLEKYEILDKFFNNLICAIRLLRLNGSMCTFTNISRKIEILTDRKFYYSHLAQLKFILPEVIEIKKILVRDDQTSCMKQDLHVNMNFSVIQNDEKLESVSVNLEMRNLFRARLGDEVPMDQLPEPFNQSSQLTSFKNMTYTVFEKWPVVASHIPQSFKRRFSKHVSTDNAETIGQESRVLIRKVTCELKTPSPVIWSPKLPPPIKRPKIVVKNKTSILERIKETGRKPAISEAKWKEKMITGLPKLFNLILFFFQSINRSFVTKDELMHMIISNHLDTVDRSEAEDQLRLLQELVQEWIYEKMTSSGDIFFCINKISSTESIHKKLSEAVAILSALYLVRPKILFSAA